MAKKKSGTKKPNGYFGGLAGTVNKQVPSFVTKPLYFILGTVAGRFVVSYTNKMLKVVPAPDGLKFTGSGWKDAVKALAGPVASIALGGGASWYGNSMKAKSKTETEKMLASVLEYAGYGTIAYGAATTVKTVFPKISFLGLGEADFEGSPFPSAQAATPETKAEIEASMRALIAASENGGAFRAPGDEEDSPVAELSWVNNMGSPWNAANAALTSRNDFEDAADAIYE